MEENDNAKNKNKTKEVKFGSQKSNDKSQTSRPRSRKTLDGTSDDDGTMCTCCPCEVFQCSAR